ncbi:MAG: hypothetical protein Q7U18_00455 [Methylobacter sp.]|nr:hypothetical protein [Methylobacter sp.]
MERCPSCMARLTGAVVCPRCQADLGGVTRSEQYAQHWLAHAVRFWSECEPTLAVLALTKSLRLKQTSSALTFCGFIIQQQGQKVLVLLAQRQLSEANNLLFLLRGLQPDNQLLRQLQGFSDALLIE